MGSSEFASNGDPLKAFQPTLDNYAVAFGQKGFLKNLVKGKDLIAELGEHSVHQVNAKNYKGKMSDAKSQFDIGKVDPIKGARQGMFVEFRKLKGGVPWTNWRQFALLAVEVSALINEG